MADNESTPGNQTNTAQARNGSSKSQTNASRSSAARSASRGSARASGASEAAMKKQITELKREVSRLNRALSNQAEEAAGTAHGWYESAADRAHGLYDDASQRASRAARQLRSQAHSVSETVQQNPGTFSTAMVIGGLFGLLVGLTMARSSEPDRDWFRQMRDSMPSRRLWSH
ncbi:hypothetical protein [Mesorhizobium sp. B1-1-8]|uniref:hypothetical protein n=1 Tax=Mesorhizobium sp. B1-1-8 TaxID=2589976 RepID=UPI001129AF55|nr:hypothetical protein [Mesorhizobium sp. B1-1-8]UCI06287.1 hypothetical protein FJ974_21065 [Mesorhizobium sp. B1-1-8]